MARSTNSGSVHVEFRATLPYRLTSVLTLLANASRYEGFDQQIYVTYAALPLDLRRDIELVFAPLAQPLVFTRLYAESPQFDDFTSFIGWLSQLNETEVRESVDAFLQDLAKGTPESGDWKMVPVPSPDDEQALRRFLTNAIGEWCQRVRADASTFEYVVRLLRDTVELKARLVFTVTQFWGAHYKDIYDTCTPIVARSLQFHRQCRYTGEATDIYLAVTGKNPSSEETRHKFQNASRLVFLPCCHSGPYVAFMCPVGDERTLLLIYNCRSSSGSDEGQQGVIRDVFPPLKALADETRLGIVLLLREQELYAQQIVDRLDLSQSSVSRHLNLLVASGILSVRKENGMKFYRINGPAMEYLVGRLHTLVGKVGSD
jgi:DNA-binding transcriptional ArsR family regulator